VIRRSALLTSMLVLVSSSALAQALTCVAPPALPVERSLRQLYLDLLGRPPTLAEYRAAQAKGHVDAADVAELMGREEFYARMKEYHRALLRSNITASLPVTNDMRLNSSTDGAMPFETRGNPSSVTRGRVGLGCDHFIAQDDCQNPATQQDPHAEGPASAKQCRDANGVPLPVSFDYDPATYLCTPLTGATSCPDAVTKGLLPDKYLYFCDMRRTGANLVPNKCLPDPTKPTTMALTQEVVDGAGRVVSFVNPTPSPTAAFNQLDRCTLTMAPRNGVRGTYAVQRGCFQREGWVKAPAPFWDTSGATEITACAIEAQDRPVNPATMATCDGAGFLTDRSCGCGARFRRCEAGDGSVLNARIAAFNEEPLLIADSVLRRDEDYFNLLTTRRSFVNGVLSAFYQQDQGAGLWSVSTPLARANIPAVPYTTDPKTFVEYVRGDNASGVLTTPAWLYRFPTQRSRVNQFYNAFLCKAFTVPAGVVAPDPTDSCNRENNLAQRCGCKYCHATIEPTGAHWGRYGERNAQYLDPAVFPKLDAKCRDCALSGNTICDFECSNYVMQAYDGDGAKSLGLLKTYLYRTDEEAPNIEGGPRKLVERMLQTGDLERCAVKNVWKEFLGRPMSAQEEQMYLDQMVQSFVDEKHNFKKLIEAVVTSDAYRRID